jgi:hypothetical protein
VEGSCCLQALATDADGALLGISVRSELVKRTRAAGPSPAPVPASCGVKDALALPPGR